MNILEEISLKNKNALIVGGTGALGRGIAMGLAEAGASVMVASRDISKCQKTADYIESRTGSRVGTHTIDLTGDKSVFADIDDILSQIGHLDIVVNSAGINIRKPAEDYTIEDWDLVQNVHLRGTFFVCQAVGRHMINNSIKGRIINIASVNALVVARPHIVSYVAAKGGVMQLTKALANEWAQYGITVNSIAPGFFDTELTKVLFEDPKISAEIVNHIPMGHPGDADHDLKGIAVYLASSLSSYTTGQMFCIDGGYSII